VPTTRRSRTIAAPVMELWEIVSDPHHLPRWWPRIDRVEDVRDGAFTEVMHTKKGKTVRADFDVVRVDAVERVLVWSQRVAGTPFENVLLSAETELRLSPQMTGPTASEVTIELRQELISREAPFFFSFRRRVAEGRGMGASKFGAMMVSRAAAATLEEALNGLEQIGG
jgi:uncharacterized protein YndB with AHSA1/START domain